MERDTDNLALTIVAEPPPLDTDVNGVIRVGSTRVTLDTVVLAFQEGATAEEIVYQYPALKLADVYAVLAYYLQRQAEVDMYVQRRRDQAQTVRERNEAQFDPQGIRERLLARRSTPDVTPGR